jgi:hypothetical protein
MIKSFSLFFIKRAKNGTESQEAGAAGKKKTVVVPETSGIPFTGYR